jgi:outer membrane biosynthesis protein TonB
MLRQRDLFVLLLLAAFATAGCAGKHIVSAAPPSVATPPPEEPAPAPQPPAPPPVETKTEPPPETPPAAPPAAPAKRPVARPRPAPTETADPMPPKPAPPQISPQLSAKDLALAKTNTTSNITTAEKNLQLASGKQLSAAQKDLVEKISGFLGQAHEAILADDWVRAQNLAEKARVLSVELTKSF